MWEEMIEKERAGPIKADHDVASTVRAHLAEKHDGLEEHCAQKSSLI
jgi:hypothetical protein